MKARGPTGLEILAYKMPSLKQLFEMLDVSKAEVRSLYLNFGTLERLHSIDMFVRFSTACKAEEYINTLFPQTMIAAYVPRVHLQAHLLLSSCMLDLEVPYANAPTPHKRTQTQTHVLTCAGIFGKRPRAYPCRDCR